MQDDLAIIIYLPAMKFITMSISCSENGKFLQVTELFMSSTGRLALDLSSSSYCFDVETNAPMAVEAKNAVSAKLNKFHGPAIKDFTVARMNKCIHGNAKPASVSLKNVNFTNAKGKKCNSSIELSLDLKTIVQVAAPYKNACQENNAIDYNN